MFSQFKNVMESLAQQPTQPRGTSSRSSSREFSPERPEAGPRTSSSFNLQNAENLAESALFSLRKSLVNQRPFAVVSPEPRAASPLAADRELKAFSKLNLEDRLRASFAIGEASTSTTPDRLSHAPSPRLFQTPSRVLSPKSTPLPDSPVKSPSLDDPLQQPPPFSLSPSSVSYHPLSETLETQTPHEVIPFNTKQGDSASPNTERLAEADIPLPPFSPEATEVEHDESNTTSPTATELPEEGSRVYEDDVSEVLKESSAAAEGDVVDESSSLKEDSTGMYLYR